MLAECCKSGANSCSLALNLPAPVCSNKNLFSIIIYLLKSVVTAVVGAGFRDVERGKDGESEFCLRSQCELSNHFQKSSRMKKTE